LSMESFSQVLIAHINWQTFGIIEKNRRELEIE